MKKIKNCTNIFITILLVCVISITMMSGFVRFSLANKNIYLNLLEKTDTYAAVTDSLYKKMSSILGSDISEDLKKSIITEEDVKKEADVVLNCMINNLITGQAIAPEIDTRLYKERIADALKSLTGYDAYMNTRKDLTSSSFVGDYTIEPMNFIAGSDSKAYAAYLKTDNSNDFSGKFVIENLATRAELEAQGRAMLKEKGMTEAQARAKLAEKGISEEQVWQYLRDNGYLDGEEDETEKGSNSTADISSVPDTAVDSENKAEFQQEADVVRTEDSQETDSISKKKIQNTVMSIMLEQNMNFEEKMDKLYSELMNEAEIIINREIDSFNISKLINSNIFKISVKITSALYKSFYLNLLALIILILILGAVNSFEFIKAFDSLAKSVLISGILWTSILAYVYVSKVYINFSGILSKPYLQTMFVTTTEYFCRILLISSAGIFIAGLIMNIFTIQKKINGR